MPKSLPFTPIFRVTWGYKRGTSRGVCVCVGGGGGLYVASRLLHPHMWCYPGVKFKLLARSLITGPSPVPVLVVDWGAELCGSSVSRNLQWRLLCVRLPTPILDKGVIPFYLLRLNSVERAQLGPPSLGLRPLKEQMAKNVSVLTVLTVLVFLDIFPPGQE